MAALGQARGSGVSSDEVLTVESLGAYHLGWAYCGFPPDHWNSKIGSLVDVDLLPYVGFPGSF